MLPNRKNSQRLLTGLLLASAAATHAADGNTPQFYGTINLSLDNENYGGVEKVQDQWSLNSNNSRIGVRHTIPLQNGLNAVLKAEFRINTDDGRESDGQTISQRDIYAGFSGHYGQLIAGRFNTPLRTSEGKLDLFNHLHGDIDAVLGGQNRADNIIQYTSPEFSAIRVNAAFIPGENKDTDGDGDPDHNIADAFSFSAVYNHNNLYAAAALDRNQPAGTTVDGLNRSDRIQLAAGWTLHNTRIAAIAQQAHDTGNSALKEKAAVFNVSQRVQNSTLKAQYGVNKGDFSGEKRTLKAIGADYQLDKSAYLFAAWSTLTEQQSHHTDRVFSLGFNQSF